MNMKSFKKYMPGDKTNTTKLCRGHVADFKGHCAENIFNVPNKGK